MSITSPLPAIRAKCIDCCGGSVADVRECHITRCALHPFRMGRNPFRTVRVLTDEQKAAGAARLAAARNARKAS